MTRAALSPVSLPGDGLVRTPQTTDLLATWWAQRPGGNWYWRCEIPSRALPGQVVALHTTDLQPSAEGIYMPRQQGDAAIWSYIGNATRGILMAAQQDAGYKVLVEVDDNYLIPGPHVPGGHTDWRSKADKTTDDKHSHQAHRRLAECASGVIVTTEQLAKPYREISDHVYVCPNSIDPADWDEPEKPNDGIFRIGYAASHSHFFDAADVRRALSWAADQPNVEVLMYGLKPQWSFPFRQVPWTKDLADYRRSLQALDVGVCPLRPNTWSDCKSDIKFLEYGMSGALPIPSRAEPYRSWWDWGGPVCESPKGFLKAIKWCVANQDAAAELAAKAKAIILRDRTIQDSIHTWRQAVAS